MKDLILKLESGEEYLIGSDTVDNGDNPSACVSAVIDACIESEEDFKVLSKTTGAVVSISPRALKSAKIITKSVEHVETTSGE